MFDFLRRHLSFLHRDPKREWLARLEKSLKFIQESAEVGIQKLTGPMPTDKKSQFDFFQQTKTQTEELLRFVELLKKEQENSTPEFQQKLEQLCSYLVEQTRDLPSAAKAPPPSSAGPYP
ncbi:MAG: hypothetical protein AABX70_01805 [Nanoarchaeota archaeon]